MNDGYIEEQEWFKCDIDGTIYNCYLEYCASRHLSKPWVKVTVRKYIQKKWWFFKWREEEFECADSPNITVGQYRLINDNFYFKSEYVKGWVEGALSRRVNNLTYKKSQIEEEKNLKLLKEI
jgi:hypothetical protein